MCVEPHSDLNMRTSQRLTSAYDFIDLICKPVLKEPYVSFQISLLYYPLFAHLTSLQDPGNATSVVYPEICRLTGYQMARSQSVPFLCLSSSQQCWLGDLITVSQPER